jgi:hypothetical protein
VRSACAALKNIAEAYDKAIEVMAQTAVSEHGRETMRSFLEKRQPVFTKTKRT